MTKRGKLVGMAMTHNDRANFLKTIFREFVYKIYPSEGENLDNTEQEEKTRLEDYKSNMFKGLTPPDKPPSTSKVEGSDKLPSITLQVKGLYKPLPNVAVTPLVEVFHKSQFIVAITHKVEV